MKEKPKPKVPMPGSCLDDPISGSLRGDPGSGDSERKAEPSAPNFTPTVIDTVGSVGKAEQLGRNHGRKKSSRSTPTTLEISGLPSVVVQGLRGSPHSVCDVGQDCRGSTTRRACKCGLSSGRSRRGALDLLSSS